MTRSVPLSARSQRKTLAADAGPAPAFIYLLADHLDTTLAIGEDLIALGQITPPVNCGAAGTVVDPSSGALPSEPTDSDAVRRARRDAVARVRELEMRLVAHVIRTRKHAEQLAKNNDRFAPLARAFVSGTNALYDAALKCSDTTTNDFQTGDDLTAYLRARHLIADDAPGQSAWDMITVSEDFPVLGLIPVAVILDNAARFLDALDVEYDLYPTAAPEDDTDGNEEPTGTAA